MTKKATAKKTATKKAEKKFVWKKGPRTEKLTFGDGDIIITIRGLTYRECLHVAPMEGFDSNFFTLRMGIVNIEGLTFEEDGETVEYKFEFEDYDCNGKIVKILTEQCYEEVIEPNVVIVKQLLAAIIDLTRMTEEEAESVRLFRSKG